MGSAIHALKCEKASWFEAEKGTAVRIRCLVCLLLFVVLHSPRAEAQLQSHIEVENQGTLWSYTVSNDEPMDSVNFISSFTLLVGAPISVIGTPEGWDFDTDGQTFVFWFNTDVELPYIHDIAPQTSRSGFAIESLTGVSGLQPYGLTSWDHSGDTFGPDAAGEVLAPVTLASGAPEPGTLALLGAGMGMVGLLASRKR